MASTEECPSCGAKMSGEGEDFLGTERFECPKHCGGGPYFKEDGLLMDPDQRREHHRSSGGGATCESCSSSLSGGDMTLPYEDGSNTLAYVKCSSCGHKNEREGFGE